MHDSQMVDELADMLRDEVERSRGRGLRIPLLWLANALNGDGALARLVLRKAGFTPDPATWSTGRGKAELADFTYPEALADRLRLAMDDYV